MYFFGLFDAIGGPALVIGGGIALLFVLGVAFISETVVLLLLRWGSVLRCARDAVLVNLASGIAGIVLAVLFWNFLIDQDAFWPIAVGSWALSVAIEGAVLMWLGDRPGRRAWVAALVMNIVSYAILAGTGAALGSL